MAYVLLCALRRIGLQDTDFAQATCGILRLKLLKIATLVRISVRRLRIAMASACPAAQDLGPRRSRARNRRHGPLVARITRAAVARSVRGTTHRPAETRRPETKTAQPGATDGHAYSPHNQKSNSRRIIQQHCEKSPRQARPVNCAP
jgi:hypothetical protein